MNRTVYKIAQAMRWAGYDFREEDDTRVKAMKKTIHDLGSIQFQIEIAEDGSWVAESVNIDGIITGGTTKEHINETIKDAIFTYFEIPPHLCNDMLMKGSVEPIKLEQRVYA